MVRGLLLAGAFLIGGGVLSSADEAPAPKPAAEPAEVLAAQLDTKRAYARAAEVALAAAQKKLERAEKLRAAGTSTAEELEQAKAEFDAAAAQHDIRKAEARETEVRLKLTKADTPRPAAVGAVAAFNMAAVMRDFDKAKYQVYQLNQKRIGGSFDLVKWRAEVQGLQAETTRTADPKEKEEIAQRMRELTRKIEDKDRAINKMLNDDASAIIGRLYDDIKAVVDELAEANGYQIVFAYPDAVTDAEKANPQIKELKLKPPAAHPFYLSKTVDVTDAVLRKLNAAYPALDEKGQKVDVTKLATPNAPPTAQRP